MIKKRCSKCRKLKAREDYYLSKGNMRGECKKCTIRRNVSYQKKKQVWKHRFVDKDETRKYMVEYYQKNKKKYQEYRLKFKKKYPNYYRDYARRRKGEKVRCLQKRKNLDREI